MKVLSLIYDGVEELEAISTIDVLRRMGIEVDMASNNNEIISAHKVTIGKLLNINSIDLNSYDAIFLPGGPHHKKIEADPKAMDIIKDFCEKDKYLLAICAAPSLIGKLGYLKNKEYTCWPSNNNSNFGGKYLNQQVVRDGKLLTGHSAGASMKFAYAVVNLLLGELPEKRIKEDMIYED